MQDKLSFLPLIAAPAIGSFLGVIVQRFASPAAILWGRSACPYCGVRLGALDLLPIASWLALRGRCRRCGVRIGAFYPLIELAALGVALWSVAATQGWVVWASCALGWALLALAAIDARHHLLPDFLTVPLLLGGLAVNALFDWQSFAAASIGAAAGFLFVVALRAIYDRLRSREGIGLGDAKLLAACGAWVGWDGLPSVVLAASLGGLLFALMRAARIGHLSLGERVPFGPFLCAGLWLVWLYGPLG
jgi:leader peptidase (prepilin peptidase) / N-methyltransferase